MHTPLRIESTNSRQVIDKNAVLMCTCKSKVLAEEIVDRVNEYENLKKQNKFWKEFFIEETNEWEKMHNRLLTDRNNQIKEKLKLEEQNRELTESLKDMLEVVRHYRTDSGFKKEVVNALEVLEKAEGVE